MYDYKFINQAISDIPIKPSRLLIKANLSNVRGFVKISANYFLVQINSKAISPRCT